jgi:hypothetical protein
VDDGPAPAESSELVEVLPLTDQILIVHFDDGSLRLAAQPIVPLVATPERARTTAAVDAAQRAGSRGG